VPLGGYVRRLVQIRLGEPAGALWARLPKGDSHPDRPAQSWHVASPWIGFVGCSPDTREAWGAPRRFPPIRLAPQIIGQTFLRI